jgi:hypothetical protein
MQNDIYSVELEVHYEGISKYFLFSSWEKAQDFADGFMTQREQSLDKRYWTADVRAYEEDVVRVWEDSGENVIIRKKSLLG